MQLVQCTTLGCCFAHAHVCYSRSRSMYLPATQGVIFASSLVISTCITACVLTFQYSSCLAILLYFQRTAASRAVTSYVQLLKSTALLDYGLHSMVACSAIARSVESGQGPTAAVFLLLGTKRCLHTQPYYFVDKSLGCAGSGKCKVIGLYLSSFCCE